MGITCWGPKWHQNPIRAWNFLSFKQVSLQNNWQKLFHCPKWNILSPGLGPLTITICIICDSPLYFSSRGSIPLEDWDDQFFFIVFKALTIPVMLSGHNTPFIACKRKKLLRQSPVQQFRYCPVCGNVDDPLCSISSRVFMGWPEYLKKFNTYGTQSFVAIFCCLLIRGKVAKFRQWAEIHQQLPSLVPPIPSISRVVLHQKVNNDRVDLFRVLQHHQSAYHALLLDGKHGKLGEKLQHLLQLPSPHADPFVENEFAFPIFVRHHDAAHRKFIPFHLGRLWTSHPVCFAFLEAIDMQTSGHHQSLHPGHCSSFCHPAIFKSFHKLVDISITNPNWWWTKWGHRGPISEVQSHKAGNCCQNETQDVHIFPSQFQQGDPDSPHNFCFRFWMVSNRMSSMEMKKNQDWSKL